MDEEFLKKFVGKEVQFVLAGCGESWKGQTLISIIDGIAEFSAGTYTNYIESYMIVVISVED